MPCGNITRNMGPRHSFQDLSKIPCDVATWVWFKNLGWFFGSNRFTLIDTSILRGLVFYFIFFYYINNHRDQRDGALQARLGHVTPIRGEHTHTKVGQDPHIWWENLHIHTKPGFEPWWRRL